MTQLTRIHANKQPHRIHYIVEWADKRGMRQVDIVKETGIDKSSVSRWFSGSLPTEAHLVVLADLFQIDVPALFRDPEDDWLQRLFRGRSKEEREKAALLLEILFRKAG